MVGMMNFLQEADQILVPEYLLRGDQHTEMNTLVVLVILTVQWKLLLVVQREGHMMMKVMVVDLNSPQVIEMDVVVIMILFQGQNDPTLQW